MNGKKMTIRFSTKMYNNIEKFRKQNELASWADSLRLLIHKGLKR